MRNTLKLRSLLPVLMIGILSTLSWHAYAGPLVEPTVIDATSPAPVIKLSASKVDNYKVDGFNGQIDGLFLYRTPGMPPSMAPARWLTQPGSKIKVELTNHLPCIKSTNGANIANSDLTNLHTHGLVVSPLPNGNVQGDNAFIELDTDNPADCGKLSTMRPPREPNNKPQNIGNYEVSLPADHFFGMSWFHPHVHTVAGPQVAGGMSGLIEIGNVWKYAYAQFPDLPGTQTPINPDEYRYRDQVDIKHLMLKDVQLKQTAAAPLTYIYSPTFDPQFCGPTVARLNNGVCDSAISSKDKWLFTVNGSAVPTINITNSRRHIWRIGNVGATVSYQLRLRVTKPSLPAGQDIIPVQVLMKDGVALGVDPGAKRPVWQQVVTVMPSARTELGIDPLYICRRIKGLLNVNDFNDQPGTPCTMPAVEASLETVGPVTGADTWPKGTLALVSIAAITKYDRLVDPGPVGVQRDKPDLNLPYAGKFTDPVNRCITSTITAQQYRLIGLKNYIDAKNIERFEMATSGPFLLNGSNFPKTIDPGQYAAYSMMRNDLCIGADIANKYSEIWVVRNDAQELHNFHIHQMKFELMSVNGNPLPIDARGKYPQQDNYPIQPLQWVQIRITFDHAEQAGRFMYHCHILEHEDKGMMSNIRVIDTSKTAVIVQRGMDKSRRTNRSTELAKAAMDIPVDLLGAVSSNMNNDRLAQYRAAAPPWMADQLCTTPAAQAVLRSVVK
jgi:FtsP/CotA-like multicopper oxidase with cupredoxin domain